MAIAFGRSLGSTSGTADFEETVLTTSAIANIGELVVVFFDYSPIGASTLQYVYDSVGNDYGIAKEQLNGLSCSSCIAYSFITSTLASGQTITTNLVGSSAKRILGAAAFTGFNAVHGPDKTAGANGTGTAITVNLGPTTVADELLVSAVGQAFNGLFTPGASFTEVFDLGVAGLSMHSQYRIVSSINTYAVPVTSGVTNAWSIAAVSFASNPSGQIIGTSGVAARITGVTGYSERITGESGLAERVTGTMAASDRITGDSGVGPRIAGTSGIA